jgi:hypothetical protein
VKYMLALFSEEGGLRDASPEEMKAVMEAWDAFTKEAQDAGALVAGEGLQESATATTVRIQDREPIVTDGPFAETKEQLGGFYVLECKDLDQALEWARKIPFQNGSVEVRPVIDYEAMHQGGSGDREAARS